MAVGVTDVGLRGPAYTRAVPDAPLAGLQIPAARDTTTDLVRLVVLHAALVALPVLVLAGVVLVLVAGPVAGLVLAVVLAALAGAAVTALRLRDVDERIARAIGARPAPPDELPRLHSLLDNVAMSVGVAPPQPHVIDSAERNAITWGDGRGPLQVAFTTGLLDAVDRIQLEALVGRQLAVGRDGSVDVLTVAAALFEPFGALDGPVSSVALRAVDDRAVVRADLEGVRASGYPPGLVAALEVVEAGTSDLPGVPRALTGACLASPGAGSGAFGVHPTLEDRVDLLREI